MRRHNSTKFTHYDRGDAYNVIIDLHDSIVRATTPTLTDSEMLSLVGLTNDASAGSFKLHWSENIRLHFNLTRARHFNVGYKLHPEADERTVGVIKEWLTQRIELETDFGRLQALVKYLFSEFGDVRYTKKEIRYHFPGILALVKSNGLEEITVPRKNSVVSYPIRRAIERCSITLATALMFKSMTFDTAPSVKVDLSTVDYDEEGFKFQSYDRYY